MFTEQPAPPPVAQIQPQPVVVAASPITSPTSTAAAKVAAPETLPTPSVAASPAPVAAPEPTPEVAPQPSPSPKPMPPQVTEPQPKAVATPSSIAQRRQEVEQALIEITTKARAAQKQTQQQQSATDAAKYAEAEEFKQALEAANNPKLSASAKAKLLSLIKAKQAKASQIVAAKGVKSGKAVAGNLGQAVPGRISSPESAPSPGYSTQPLLSMGQAELQLRLGKLLGKGNLSIAFPLTIPAPITSVFGWRVHPISGSSRFHRGIDLGAPYGSPVIAAKTGRVEAAEFVDGYGLTVIMNHGTTQQTLYAHLSQVFVKPGDVIKQGQLIALVGSTGLSTGPHLHFEVHELSSEGWVALDPTAVLNQAIAVAQGTAPGSAQLKGLRINLAASGLMDLHAAPDAIAPADLGNTLLSGIFAGSADTQAAMRVPFALLPPAIPELSWLISPLVDGLPLDQGALILPLLGLSETMPAVSFAPVPALQSLPQAVAFTPATPDWMERSPVRLATTQPLANLTIAAAVPGAIRPTEVRPTEVRPTVPSVVPNPPTTSANFSQNPVQMPNLSTIKLSDKRLKSLKVSDRPRVQPQTRKNS